MLPDHKNKQTVSPKTIKGHYVNYFEICHSAFEFVVDFGQSYPESQETEHCARIILSPGCAKALFSILGESIGQYVQNFESDENK